MKTTHTKLIAATLGALAVTRAAAEPVATKPNILIILADDLGYGDLQCYNPERGKILTPNMDRLAAQGMRFTDGHSSAAGCTPSRYALLTGRYDWRSRQKGLGVFGGFGGPPLIAPERLTIASLAKQNGYRTACIGKWHIGWDWPIESNQYPLLGLKSRDQQGADYQTPTPTAEQLAAWQTIFSKPLGGGPTALGFDSYFGIDTPGFPPFCFIENDRTVGIPSAFLPAENFIPNTDKMEGSQGPALKDWNSEVILPALQERACAFLGEAAKEPFLLYLPLTSPHAPWSITKEWRGRSGLSSYADWVMQTDAVVGAVLDALEKSGAAENTLVILSSDNGYGPRRMAETLKHGHYSSGPLNGFKAQAYEGGHRVPFIVRWPAMVKPGTVSAQLVNQVDIMATMAELFGTALPENAGEDSFSFLPLLKGIDKPIREHAVNSSGQGAFALRRGDWKLILDTAKRLRAEVELFNLAEDLGEKKDLAAQYPERVAEMRALLEKLVRDGRSTPGAKQRNDGVLTWCPLKGEDQAK